MRCYRLQVLAALLASESFDGDHEALGIHLLHGAWADASLGAGVGCERLELLLRRELIDRARRGSELRITVGCPMEVCGSFELPTLSHARSSSS